MACSCYHKDMLRREIGRSEKYKSGYLIAEVKLRDYKKRYCKLLKDWNDLVPKYNTLKVEKNELIEDKKELQEFLDDNWEYIERLQDENAELKKMKLKCE